MAQCGGEIRSPPRARGRAGASQGRRHRHGCPAPTRAAREATVTIPIVMTNEADPVGTGFVASLARPGGNLTGLSTLAPELSRK
ncbi:MAG: ABC transporter substrate binding protein [Candidatus Binatia bacterium]